MTNPKLESALRPIVREYGLGNVLQSLGKIAVTDDHNGKLTNGYSARSPRIKKSKPNAAEYADKMELRPDKQDAITALAERFERKDFLPTFGDIRNFCDIYGIDVPASKTRASAIPRVFKFLANEMEADEVQRILDYDLFSGPSRLGPIADAIRRNGRASRASRLAK